MTVRRYSRVEKVLAVLLLLAIPVAAGTLVGPRLWQAYHLRESEIASLAARRAELAARQRDLDQLESTRRSLAEAEPSTFGLVVAQTVELARVEIQKQVQEIARANGATLTSARAVEGDDPTQTLAAVQLTLSASDLPAFLVDLANANPLIFVDEIRVERVPAGRDERETVLDVDLTMSAYTLLADGAER